MEKDNRDIIIIINTTTTTTTATTTENTKSEQSDKVVTIMIFHALDDPEDGEPLVVALLSDSLSGLFGL